MRPNSYLSVALVALSCALAGCAAHKPSSSMQSPAAPSPLPSIAPLQSCETRELRFDGAEVVLVANVDRTLASVTVVASRSTAARKRATAEIEAQLGTPHVDTRIEQRPWKDGLVELTDPCGRLVTPTPEPT
ncbi:MAG: hypothetical protein HKL92_07140 [Candidatus Eremiobacteraeota bacterium]|nr:hypothetical protein [Candidatus Eremiobacteraeota bacterium]NNM93100.1 hypothetical protein [Candidatus Eremiobacteraeota bacterium]